MINQSSWNLWKAVKSFYVKVIFAALIFLLVLWGASSILSYYVKEHFKPMFEEAISNLVDGSKQIIDYYFINRRANADS